MNDRLPPVNARLAPLLRDRYRVEDLSRLRQTLDELGTLAFSRLDSGLFSASPSGAAMSGYENVWVRDNVHVAYAQLVRGDVAGAVGVARALLAYFHKYRRRLLDVISGAVAPADVTSRPHVRFDGRALAEIPGQKWAHAQNDALGYFVWLVSLLARRGALRLSVHDGQTLLLFVRYFRAIRFWQDADSGHWEEARKVSASSIGVVVAALHELMALLRSPDTGGELAGWRTEDVTAVDELRSQGTAALTAILPGECADPSPRLHRAYDGALVFLVHPLRVVDEAMATTLLANVEAHLSGEVGIRRYVGDSYWAPDYDAKLPLAERTRDFSDDVETRDRLLERPGDEAQWCIFDGYISAHHGVEFARTRAVASCERQVHHLNRALRQVTAQSSATPNRCPELYYLKEGRLVPNPHTPLQWAQASLLIALEQMAATAALGD